MSTATLTAPDLTGLLTKSELLEKMQFGPEIKRMGISEDAFFAMVASGPAGMPPCVPSLQAERGIEMFDPRDPRVQGAIASRCPSAPTPFRDLINQNRQPRPGESFSG